MPRRARIGYRMRRKHSGPGAGGRPCEPSPKGENVKERAPRVGGDALSNPPGCGKWVGHDYNAPTSWRFQGSKEKEARPLSAAPPPAQAAARCAAELQICRLPANRFIPSDQKRGGLRVCDRGGSRLTVDGAAAPHTSASPVVVDVSLLRRSLLKDATAPRCGAAMS